VGGPPLFGAQQIPGEDPTLRVAEVAFPLPGYARCEIVKVSSVTDMAREILRDLERRGLAELPPDESTLWRIPQMAALDEELLAARACRIAASRGYPAEMGDRCVE